jgi:hypothetical protein
MLNVYTVAALVVGAFVYVLILRSISSDFEKIQSAESRPHPRHEPVHHYEPVQTPPNGTYTVALIETTERAPKHYVTGLPIHSATRPSKRSTASSAAAFGDPQHYQESLRHMLFEAAAEPVAISFVDGQLVWLAPERTYRRHRPLTLGDPNLLHTAYRADHVARDPQFGAFEAVLSEHVLMYHEDYAPVSFVATTQEEVEAKVSKFLRARYGTIPENLAEVYRNLATGPATLEEFTSALVALVECRLGTDYVSLVLREVHSFQKSLKSLLQYVGSFEPDAFDIHLALVKDVRTEKLSRLRPTKKEVRAATKLSRASKTRRSVKPTAGDSLPGEVS